MAGATADQWCQRLVPLPRAQNRTWRGEPLEKFRRLGPWGIASGVFLGSSTTCFVSSLQYTAVANTLVIIAASPLMAGLFSWLFLGESVERRVWVGILVGMAGVGVTISGGLAAR